jgi:hypothetical protein
LRFGEELKKKRETNEPIEEKNRKLVKNQAVGYAK